MSTQSLITDVQSRTHWILIHIPESRNYTENEFLFCYWRNWEGFASEAHDPRILTSHETISRCKRKLVEKNPDYKSNDTVRRAKQLKEEAFKEWSKS